MKKYFTILLIGFILLIGCTKMGFKYMGEVCNDIFPAIGGDIRIEYGNTLKESKLLIFDPFTPAPFKFKENSAKPAEKWMEDGNEVSNRRSVRLIKSDLHGKYQVIFQEYGRKGWWWTSSDLSKIYILVYFVDSKQKGPSTYLTFWYSTDGGQKFYKNYDFTEQVGRVKSAGMYFDDEGKNGYIFTGLNNVWQTNNGGRRWTKRYIPHTELPPLIYNSDGTNIDAATVDNHGNLLFSLFEQRGTDVVSNIYIVPHDATTTDLSQEKPKYTLENKRLIALHNVPDVDHDFYLFYMDCNYSKNCNWSDANQEDNPHLRFGRLQNEKFEVIFRFRDFLPVKQMYALNQNTLAAVLQMPNTKQYKTLISNDGGKTWPAVDLTGRKVIGDYVDLKRKQYWVDSAPNKIYKIDIP